MPRLSRSSLWWVTGLATLGAIIASACFPKPPPAEKICTAGSFVYCRCEDRREGSRLCQPDETSFAECKCLASNQRSPLTNGPTDFEPVDVPPPDTGLKLDDKCAGKIAALGSRLLEPDGGAESKEIWGAAYTGGGSWQVGKSVGVVVRGPPRGGLVGGSLIAVWRSGDKFLGWTKFAPGMTQLGSVDTVSWPSTEKNPAFVGGEVGRLFHTDLGDLINEGTYNPASGWDDAIFPIGGDSAGLTNKSGPAIAKTAGGEVVAYTASGKLAIQTKSGERWSAATAVPGAATNPDDPMLAAIDDGADDLLAVYVGNDYRLHSVSRARASGSWGTPILVDTTAEPRNEPSLTSLGGGRALLVWKAVNAQAYGSVFDVAANPRWSPPLALLPDNPRLVSPPVVARGSCASEATATLVRDDGTVALALFKDGKWSGPFVVPGFTNIVYAGAGEIP